MESLTIREVSATSKETTKLRFSPREPHGLKFQISSFDWTLLQKELLKYIYEREREKERALWLSQVLQTKVQSKTCSLIFVHSVMHEICTNIPLIIFGFQSKSGGLDTPNFFKRKELKVSYLTF